MGFRLPKCRWFQQWPRVAWCCRWVLGSVAVLGLFAWIASHRVQVEMWRPRWGYATLTPGRVVIVSDPLRPDGRSRMEYIGTTNGGLEVSLDRPSGFNFLPYGIRFDNRKPPQQRPPELGPSPKIWELPVWPPFALCVLPALAAWWNRWLVALAAWRTRWLVKRKSHSCLTCGYPRNGLAPGAKCPECGHAPVA